MQVCVCYWVKLRLPRYLTLGGTGGGGVDASKITLL